MIPPEADRDRPDRAAGSIDVFDLSWSGETMVGIVRVEFDLDTAESSVAMVLEPPGEQTVGLVAAELALPNARMELRGPGIWIELMCESPLDHWTVGLEAFGVTVDPDEPITAETRGTPVPLGLDLDLDTIEPGPEPVPGGFVVPVRVHGEVLIGPTRHEVDARGTRSRGGPQVSPPGSTERADATRLRQRLAARRTS